MNKIRFIQDRNFEKFIAFSSFAVAAVLAFIGQQMSEQGDIKGGTLMMCAQFLTLTATLFGLDYKLNSNNMPK